MNDNVFDTFGRHVSSGKVAFFRQAGIEFVPGRREGIYLWNMGGRRLIRPITLPVRRRTSGG